MQEGSRLGPYELIKRIGLGGMAEIYLARTTGIGGFEKYLALKVIHPKYAEDQEFIDMLIDEAKIVVQLNHVNVGQIFDLGCIDDAYYIAMEFVDGRDLYQLLVRCAEDDVSIPFDIIAFVAKETAAALQYAHTKTDRYGRPLNLIHRDVSPQNVLLSFDGQVKLVDFGIAKANQRRQQTESGVIKGKFFYMSPEQAWGDPLDGRSDVFSCGICLYEMITGEMLYKEDRALVLLDKVRRAVIPNIRERRPDIPPALEEIVMKALARDRDDRFSSAGALQTALSSFLYGHWPSFSQQRVGQFLQENFTDRSEATMVAASPEDPPTVPSPLVPDDPLMEAEDFDRTYGQSVIFALGAEELQEVEDWEDDQPATGSIDYDDGDVTMASMYNVDELTKSTNAIVEPSSVSSSGWAESGEHTELLDGSMFQNDSIQSVTSEVTGSMGASDEPTSVFSAHELAEPKRTADPEPDLHLKTTPDMPSLPPQPQTSGGDRRVPAAVPSSTSELTPDSAPRVPAAVPRSTSEVTPDPVEHPRPQGRQSANEVSEKNRSAPSARPRTPSPLKLRQSRQSQPDMSIGERLKAKVFSAGGVTVIALLGLITYAALELAPIIMDPPVSAAVLVIGSSPPGATVIVDGDRSSQLTPARIEGFTVGGRHDVRLERDGYRSHTESLSIAGMANEQGVVEVRRQFVLQRSQGTLVVTSDPPEAEVYLDGRYIGDTPLTKPNIKRKERRVSLLIRKQGFIEKRENLDWGKETTVKVKVKLTPR